VAAEQDRNGLGRRVTAPVRVVVLGMPCAFTRVALDIFLRPDTDPAGINLAALVLAIPGADLRDGSGRPAGFSMVPDHTLIWHLGARASLVDPDWLARLDALAPDVIVSACFPWRVPEAVLSIPRFGGINIHPSLLPAGRGPEPVFWAFRWRLRETGVTVHRMARGLDTGPILARETVTIGGDATMPSLETGLAFRGGALARRVIDDLVHGTATSVPQAGASTPWTRMPVPEDLTVTTAWPAIDVARFIRAVSPVFGRVGCAVAGTGQGIGPGFRADDIVEVRHDDSGDEPMGREGEMLTVRFTPGTIRFRIAPESAPLTLHPPMAASKGRPDPGPSPSR
jgi:folate-dependent phosphoribosylglycinamide formyltransferase PurN